MRSIAFTLAIVTSPLTASAEMATYELDGSHTAVFFTVEHIGYSKALGIFGDVSGTFDYDIDTQQLANVQVTIATGSVDTFHDARNGHVKAKDFLNVSAHPEITFTAASGTPTSNASGTVTGDLTILGTSQPVTLNVQLNKAAAYPFGHKRFTLGLSMDTAINRSDWGMDYGVGNGLVGDEVAITIETEAMRME